jgi:hypothetical protein
MPAKTNRPLWRDNKRWDHACDRDERDTVSFVCPVGSVSFGALFDRRRPGTDPNSGFPRCAFFNFAA